MNKKTANNLNEDSKDDEIIATAFKRSLIALLIVASAVSIAWFISQTLQPDTVKIEDAELIAPQSTDIAKELVPPLVKFTNITSSAGISHKHYNGAVGERLLPETMGGGVAVLDYNNDQAIDLLFVNGKSWPWSDAPENDKSVSSLILYEGDGAGNFIDVTSKASLNTSVYGMGAAVGDYDNDGNIDIFVTAAGNNRLYRNIDGRRFEDVTKTAGVSGSEQAWSTGSAFFDYDQDGDLDLIALNYVRWSRDIDLQADYQLAGIGRAYGPPAQYAGTDSYLYRNEGNGTFTDVSAQSGITLRSTATDLPMGKGLSLLLTDIDDDGWVDVVVANDTVRNFLFRNNNGENFKEMGVESGLAFDNTGVATGAMGIDGAVLGQSMEQAIAIGNFGNEMTSFYVSTPGSSLFTDQAIVTGVGPASRRAVTFGLFFFDYDLDGRKDLLQANGHIEDEINVVEPGQQYAQPPQLFWNCGMQCSRQFTPVTIDAENDLSKPIVGRGAAYADIDKDGDLDVILTQIGEAPQLLRNDQTTGHNWIQFDVLNDAGVIDYGARAELVTGELRQYARVDPTRSYLSQVESTLSFGIGNRKRVDSAYITWSDGKKRLIANPAINQRHRIKHF